MKTPDDGDKPGTGLGRKIEAPHKEPSPVWRQVPGRPDYESDGSSIRKKETPLPTIFDFWMKRL